jgi:cell division protein FtsN
MAKDYKYRAQNKATDWRKNSVNPLLNIGFWQWMLITVLAIVLVVFVVYLFHKSAKPSSKKPVDSSASGASLSAEAESKQAVSSETKLEPKLPRFDFYTILPEKEVVVPDHEINTRTREERVGKAKDKRYIMQAGSFKILKEADYLKAKLGLLGIESKVHKVKVGNVVWYRVKIGPYAQMSSVGAIKARLRQNGVDVVVTELGE